MVLTEKEFYDIQNKLRRVCGIRQPILNKNGRFEVYNIPENELNMLLNKLRELDFVEDVNTRESRKDYSNFDFSKGLPTPKSLYTITGNINIEDLKENYKMGSRTILKEELGQSTSLDLFSFQLFNGTYNPFYRIILKLNGKTQNNYFSTEDSARKYYDMILKNFEKEPDYYKNGEVTFDKITIPDLIIDNIEYNMNEENEIENEEIIEMED